MAAACEIHPATVEPVSLDTTREWFAVQAHAGRERFCAHHLQTRGYTVFLPCYAEHRQWSDRVKRVERPLFDGYVFCLIGDHVLGRIVTTPGVVRIVGDGRKPLSVDRAEIEAIKRVVEAGVSAEPWQYLQAGDRVRVDMGPLRGTEGIVVRMKNRHRLIISLSVLQRSVAVEIDPAWVCRAPPVHPSGLARQVASIHA
jgi:transcription antitermination factor NusG